MKLALPQINWHRMWKASDFKRFCDCALANVFDTGPMVNSILWLVPVRIEVYGHFNAVIGIGFLSLGLVSRSQPV